MTGIPDLHQLSRLPRPVYGHAETLPNIALGYVHSHPWLQFSWASRGVLEVHTTRGRYLAPPQRAVWIPAGIEHRVQCSSSTLLRSLYIEQDRLPTRQECCVVEVSPLLRELIHAFSQRPIEYDLAGPDARLVTVLLDELAAAPAQESMLPLPADPRLQQIARQLQQQPDHPFRLQDWASQFGVSEKTLGRLFQRQTGLGFRLWRQRLRVLSALPLLEQQQPVTEVALACGYDSVSAFIAAFSTLFGRTPGDFFRSSQTEKPGL